MVDLEAKVLKVRSNLVDRTYSVKKSCEHYDKDERGRSYCKLCFNIDCENCSFYNLKEDDYE